MSNGELQSALISNRAVLPVVSSCVTKVSINPKLIYKSCKPPTRDNILDDLFLMTFTKCNWMNLGVNSEVLVHVCGSEFCVCYVSNALTCLYITR
jgi:hypothetical protein